MTNYPPLYNSPSDFAIYGNKFTAIPVPQPSSKAGSNGNIISYPPPPPQHHEYPPPCPTPSWNRSTGPLLPEGDPFYFSPAIHRRSRSSCGTTWRIILTIVTFCVGCLVLFFALAHIQGADLFPENMEPDTGAAKRYQRYARSEPIVEMKEILADFKEKVFAWKRLASLQRLIDSLLAAEYFGFPVAIEFHLDAGANESVMDYLKNQVNWPFGTSGLVAEVLPQGLANMVTSAWSAQKDTEFAFFFEDDIEASPFFFEYACRSIYEFASKRKEVIGVALNTPRYDEINLITSIWRPSWEIGTEAQVFFFQLPSSWGVLYFPWAWREFLKFYQKRTSSATAKKKTKMTKIVPASRINIWERSWKRYLAEMMFLKGQVLVYPSLPAEASFSVNHREVGEHTSGKAQSPQLERLNQQKIDYYVTPIVTAAPISLFRQIHAGAELPVVALHHDKVASLNELLLRAKSLE